MSLDTAPYPAGVPKPGMLTVRCTPPLRVTYCFVSSLLCTTRGCKITPASALHLLLQRRLAHMLLLCAAVLTALHAAQAADGDSALIAARVKTGQVQYISALVECVPFRHVGAAHAAVCSVHIPCCAQRVR